MKDIEKIDIILRQTSYTKDEAIQLLHDCNGLYIKVIEQFMGIKENDKPKPTSITQEKYACFRNIMKVEKE